MVHRGLGFFWRCIHVNIHVYLEIHSKEPYILSEEPYILSKEPYILSKQPYILSIFFGDECM